MRLKSKKCTVRKLFQKVIIGMKMLKTFSNNTKKEIMPMRKVRFKNSDKKSYKQLKLLFSK